MARQMKDSGIEWIGEIPVEWEVTKAKFILSANDGGVWGNDPADDGTDKIVIRSTEQTIDGKWCIDTPAIRDLSAVPHASSRILPGDLLITKSSGSDLHIGKTTLADDYFEKNECYFSNFIQRIRCKDYLPKLLWYLFNSNIVREQFVYLQNTTSGIGNINADIIDNLFLPNPPLTVQCRIVAFLDRKCSEIDAVIERTKATIEEYKKLKQAVITEAVTKGVRGTRKMKDSGIEWAKQIPLEWDSINPKALFTQRKDKARVGQRQLTASQQHGVIYQDEYMELTGAKVVTVEKDFDILKQVEAGDFVISMRSFQGGLEYSHLTGSISSAYVMLIPNLQLVYPRFFRWLLKSPVYINALQSTSNMVRDGQAMRYSNFAQVRLYTVPLDEQEEIADYLDGKCAAMDVLIAKKTALLTEMETYKKSLIYEYVTGKKECPEAVQQEETASEYPFYPATVNTKKTRFAQAMLMAKVLDMHGKGMGRVKLEKMLYTIETSIGFDFDTEYVREAAGPLHESIYKCEGIISRQNHWYQLHQSQYGVSYTPTKDARKYKAYYDKYFSAYNAEIERIIGVFKPYNTDQAEVVATLFAAWNDAVIAGKPYMDEDVVDDVLNDWHDSKKRYPKDMWLRAMAQMRKDELVPKGYGKKTIKKA